MNTTPTKPAKPSRDDLARERDEAEDEPMAVIEQDGTEEHIGADDDDDDDTAKRAECRGASLH